MMMEGQFGPGRCHVENMIFQALLPKCEKGDAEAWRTFLSLYTPMMSRLVEIYAPQWDSEARRLLWQEVLQALVAEDYRRLREFDHQAEREFLIDLKGLVLDLALKKLVAAIGEGRHSVDSVRSRLKDRPLAHQEIILLNLGGYSPAALEKLLLVPGSLVEKALTSTNEPEPPASSAEPLQDGAEWLRLLGEIRAARTAECPPRRLLVRILDGQASWYDKTPAENHLAGCLHCLESWVSLREADFLRRDPTPLPESEVAEYLSALPLVAAPARGSWKAKLFGH